MGDSIMRPRRRALLLAVPTSLVAGLWSGAAFAAFDHSHRAWTDLLRKNVVIAKDGNSSAVSYAAFEQERAALQNYLKALSAISNQEYEGWPKSQQLAFLINAYNAFTLELILTRYPDLKSIKDLGSVFQSPWKKEFFSLLGKERSLDDVEHGLIRAPGVFDDPRIHVAVVCASIGCPMLRDEAFVADRLGAQLDDAMRRFLSDRTRNRYDSSSGTLAVSKIFDWYRKDFEQGHKGIDSLNTLFKKYAKALTETPAGEADVRAGRYRIDHLDYDWALNDAG